MAAWRPSAILAVLALLAAAPAPAMTAEPQEFSDCLDIAEPGARLACYDRFARARRAEGAPATAAPETGEGGAQARFGKPEAERQHRIEAIEARVAGVRTNPFGKLVVTLDNGQVWLQTDAKRLRPAVGDAVIVRRSPYGAGFRLKKEGGRRFIQVRRVQ